MRNVPKYIFNTSVRDIASSGIKEKTLRDYKVFAKKAGDIDTLIKLEHARQLIMMEAK